MCPIHFQSDFIFLDFPEGEYVVNMYRFRYNFIKTSHYTLIQMRLILTSFR